MQVQWVYSQPTLSTPNLAYINKLSSQLKHNGGEGGIRTHGTLARSPVFKTGAFDHSADFTDFV